jgi:hypothetical protein
MYPEPWRARGGIDGLAIGPPSKRQRTIAFLAGRIGSDMPKKKHPSALKQTPSNHFGMPGAFALARNQAGLDWAAGALLYRLKWRWLGEKKLQRLGKEWIAMSRSDWAKEAGLSEGEMKNRALPKLRKRQFVTIRSMKLGAKKLLWMSLDTALLYEWTTEEETNQMLLNGAVPPGYEKEPGNYPYKSVGDE